MFWGKLLPKPNKVWENLPEDKRKMRLENMWGRQNSSYHKPLTSLNFSLSNNLLGPSKLQNNNKHLNKWCFFLREPMGVFLIIFQHFLLFYLAKSLWRRWDFKITKKRKRTTWCNISSLLKFDTMECGGFYFVSAFQLIMFRLQVLTR